MERQPTLEELAAMYQAQQQAGQQGAPGGRGQGGQPPKEKKKGIGDIVKDIKTFSKKYVINPMVSIPRYIAKGVNQTERFSSSFIRTSVPVAYGTAAMLPLLAVNPAAAIGAGIINTLVSYVMTNTAFKLIRDGIYIPKNVYTSVKGLGQQGLRPFKALGALATYPFRAPFKIFKAALTYPFKSAKRYGPVQDKSGNVTKGVIGGESAVGRSVGLFAGLGYGTYLGFGLDGLANLATSAKEKVVGVGQNLMGSDSSYMPRLQPSYR